MLSSVTYLPVIAAHCHNEDGKISCTSTRTKNKQKNNSNTSEIKQA